MEFWHRKIGVDYDHIKIYPYRRKVKKIRRRNIFGICQIRINDKDIRSKIETFISAVRKNLDLENKAGRGHIESP
ncbi:MAG: hypothetical protein QXT53_06440 [Ignisphaera sp.]